MVLNYILDLDRFTLHETRYGLHDQSFLFITKLKREILSEVLVEMKGDVVSYGLSEARHAGREFVLAWSKPCQQILPGAVCDGAKTLLRICFGGNNVGPGDDSACGIGHGAGDVSRVHLCEDARDN
jgi:hypothetical protein